MILYLIKSTLCLLLLIGVYQVLLARAGTFHFNRFFLLFAICFSLTIPLADINTWKTNMSEEAPVISIITGVEQQIVSFESPEIIVSAPEASVNDPKSMIPKLVFSIYGLVLLILFSRYVLNIMKLLKRNMNAQVVYHKGIKVYLLDENIAPHSFLNRIFIGKEDFHRGVSMKLLTHELAHVQQRHTYDILFIELVRIVFWFNPIIHLYSKAIRVNHEYLADRTVLQHHHDIEDYQLQLIQYISKFRSPVFASQLNYSSTKKRFEMMKKKISKTVAVISIATLIPILFLALMAFSPTVKKIEQSIETGVSSMETLMKLEVLEGENSIPLISPIERSAIHRVTSGFGQRMNPSTNKMQPHLGIDLSADTGDDVMVTADGKVTAADYESDYGNHIKVDHGNGYETLYAHLHELKVSAGESVKMGDVIGSVGNTGKSTRPHLHYEVIKDGKHVDPKTFIPDIQTKIGRNERNVFVPRGTSKSMKWVRFTIDGETHTLNNVQRIVHGSKEDKIRIITFNDSIAVVGYSDSGTIFRTFDELTEEEKAMLNTPIKKPKRDTPPTQEQLDSWLDSSKYGVWLDGKRISNEILKEYQPDDFATVFIHAQDENTKKLAKYDFQISLRTNESFEKRWQYQLNTWEKQRKF
ncbi:MAG: M23/M56 family metallopeptidase [Cyclobacteriaceae bacterium]